MVNLAVSGLVSLQGASVSLVTGHPERLETTSATSELIRVVDEAQYEGDGGPYVEAIRTGQEVTMQLPADRWPLFAAQAAQAGVRSVWSLPLQVRERTTGALNLYSIVSEPRRDPAASVARALARQAAIVLANADRMTAVLANQHLRDALESRDLIGQANGLSHGPRRHHRRPGVRHSAPGFATHRAQVARGRR